MKAALSLSKGKRNSNPNAHRQRLAARFAAGVLSLLMALTLAMPLQMNGQTSQTVSWGSTSDYSGTTSSTQNSPFGRYYGWEYKVFCYRPNTLPFSGDITKIEFLPATTQSTAGTNTNSSITINGSADSNPMQIWMKEVSSDFALDASTTFETYVSGATKVYSGNIPATTEGTMASFTLSTSFNHSQENCLLIMVRTVANSTSGDGSVYAYYKELTDGVNLCWYQREDNSDPGASTTADGVITNNLPVLSVTYNESGVTPTCTPSFSSTSDYISSFSLGSISNTNSGFSTGGYGNFTSLSTTLEAGATASASLTSSSGSGTHAAAVWIDFDDNGTFESSERVGTQSNIGASATVNISLSIPSNATPGSHTMRVVYQYNTAATSINPCASASYGEGEDYTAVIVVPQCDAPTLTGVNNITNNSASVSWTGTNDSYIVQYVNLATATPSVSSETVEVLSQGFEGSSLPTGWTNEGKWQVGTGDNNSSSTHSGSYNANTSSSDGSGSSSFLIMPAMDLSNYANAKLTCWYMNHSWSGDIDGFGVYYRTSSSGAWVELFSTTSAHSSWTQTSQLSLPSEAYVQVGFKYTDNYGYGVGLDDILITANPYEYTWTTASSNATSPYTLSSLTDDTEYMVRVIGVCNGIQSDPSNVVSFTTEAGNCPKPTNVTVSDLAASHANVSWDSEAGNYTVKYSTATVDGTTLDPVFEDGFENGLGSWTIYATAYDDASYNWQQYDLYTADVSPYNHSGSYVAMSRSWVSSTGDKSVDNWLVTPQMTLGDVVKFWVSCNDEYRDSYAVYVSTGSNIVTSSSIGDFVLVKSYAEATGTWEEISIDISAHAGQQGYVAIRHTNYGGDKLNVDDFGVYNTINTYSYGGWTTVSPNPTTESCQLTGLSAETLYEVQVQANCGGTDGSSAWSTIHFTTPDNCGAPQELASSNVTANSATLSWADDKDSYNLQYRKVYFYEDFEGSDAVPTGWTTINNSSTAGSLNWQVLHLTNHSGNNSLGSGSYIYQNTGITPDNWLISPQLDLQGTLRVWLSGYGDRNAEHFEILLSTTGTSVSDFTTTLVAESTTTNSYVEYTADLSSYTGKGYIAIHHFNCSDQNYLCVDDFGIYGTENWVTLSPNPTTETANLTNLTAGIGYEWQVRGVNCDGNGRNSEWSNVANFTTPCSITATANPSNGGTVSGAGSYNRGETATVTAAPNANYQFVNWTENGSEVTTNASYTFTVNGNRDLVANFALITYTITATANPTAGGTVTGGGTYNHGATATLTATANTGYTFSQWSDGNTSNPRTVTVTGAATYTAEFNICPAPTDLEASQITANTANLSWTGNSDSYTAKYRIPAHIDGTSEEFINTSIPDGWTRYEGLLSNVMGGSESLSTISSYWNFGTSNGVFNNHAYINNYSTNHYFWLVAPGITVPDGCALSFDLALTKYSGTLVQVDQSQQADDKFVVLITTDNGSTWTILRQWDNEGSAYVYNSISYSATGEHITIDLSSYTDQNVKIAFYAESTESGGDNNLHIDNVTIGVPVPATPWQTVETDENSVEISGLQSETTYEAQVFSDCSAEGSEIITFTTKCEAITELPWTENFESYSSGVFTASCWVNEHIEGDGSSIFNVYTSTNGTNSTHQLQLPDMSSGTMTKLMLPGINLPDENYQFSLDVYRTNSYTGKTGEGIRVFASANGEIDGATELAFIPRVFSVSSDAIPAEETANAWYTYELPITMSGTCYIILRGESQYGTSTYMDNFKIDVIPTCTRPNHPTASNVTAYEATLTWTPTGDEEQWQYKLNNSEWILVNNNTVTLQLEPESSYTAEVRAYCNENDQSDPASTSFTTPPSCPKPTALTTNNITANSAVLNWTEAGTATAWQICLNGDEDNLINIATNPYTLTELSAHTTYTAKVRAYCDESDQSYWTNPITFTTECGGGSMISANGCEDFEVGCLLSEWTNEGAASWTVGTGDNTSSTGAHTGNYNAKINHITSGNVTYLVSPAIDFSNAESASLSFAYINRQWGSDIDGFGVYYRVNGGEWNELFSTTEAHSTWTEQTIELTGLAANYQVGFKFTDNYGYGVGLDDICFTSTLPTFSITATANPSAGGTAEGSGTYSNGASVTLTATANTGYHFVNWTKNGSVASTDATYSFTATEAAAYIANFQINSHTVTYAYTGTVPTGAPAVPATQTYNYGATVPAAAVPTLEGYTFSGWDGEVTTMPDEDVTVTGYWTVNSHTVTYAYTGNVPTGAPAVPAEATYNYGAMVPAAAVPTLTGYTFSGWSGEVTTMPDNDVNVTGSWSINSYTLTVNYKYADNSQAAETHTETVNYGAGYSVASPAITGYTPDQATVSGTMPDDDVTINVTYTANSYEITATANPTAGGTITGAGTYEHGATATLTATANTGYTFDGWYENSSLVSSNAAYSFTVTAARTLEANFSCVAPSNLTAGNITATSATLNWEGEAESYNVRYRTAGNTTTDGNASLIFSDDFESGSLNNWTTIDADGDGHNWTAATTIDNLTLSAHSGSGVAYSQSYDNSVGVLSPNNWLITPQVQLGGYVSFWAVGQDPNWSSEHFAIYVSTTGTNPADFTSILSEYTTTGEYVQYTADLSDYSGLGYVAIRHFNCSAFILNVDDFELYGPSTPTDVEWITVNDVNNNSLTLNELTANTEYEVQVQSTCNTTTWSDPVTFTTLAQQMTLTVTGGEWTYDGTAHTATVVPEVTEGTTLWYRTSEEDEWSTTEPSITNVGTLHVYVKATNVNYADSYADCILEVTPKAVTITVADASKTYGEDDPTFTGTVEGLVNANDLGNITYSRTNDDENVGTYNDVLTANYTANSNYSVTVNKGDFTINKAEIAITVTGNTDSKVYNGTAQSVTGYTLNCESSLFNASNVVFNGNDIASGTNVGTYPMGLADNQFSYNDNNITATFEVVTDGSLEISTKALAITADDKDKVYGSTDPALTATITDAITDEPVNANISYTMSRGTGETVGEYEITISLGNNPNYSITPYSGTFTITQKDVTITVNNAEKTYGNADPTFTGTVEGLINANDLGSITYIRTNNDETVGIYNDVLTASYTANNNYNVIVEPGDFTISKAKIDITVTGNNASLVYNGDEQSVSGYTLACESNLFDEENVVFNGDSIANGTNVGNYAMGLAINQFTYNDDNITATFAIAEDGQLTITPATLAITVTGNTDEVVYNGQVQSVTGYELACESNLYDASKVVFSGNVADSTASGTDVNEYAMGLNANMFSYNDNNFANVTFSVTDGKLTITPATLAITVTGNTDEVVYNGQVQSVTGYELACESNLYDASKVVFSGNITDSTASGTDVDEYAMGLNANMFSYNDNNFANVTFSVTDGKFTITPLAVTVTIAGAIDTVDYDGTAHTVNGYTATANSNLYRVSGETVDFTFNGEATASRTSAGTTYMGLTADLFENTNENFTVTFRVTDGHITVEGINVTVTITGTVDTASYDGEPHTANGYTVVISNPLYTTNDFTFNGTAEASQTTVGTAYMGLTAGQFENTNPSFTVTFNVTDGHQTINPIDVTVTIVGNTNSTAYNGEEHSVSGYTATASTELYTANDFTFSGEAEAARTIVDTTFMGLAANQFANTNPNFATVTFNVTDGYQAITPINATVTIVGNTNSTAYNGEEHSVSGYTATASTELYNVNSDFTFNGTAEAARTNVDTTFMGLAANQFANTNPNFATVTFNVTDGYQAITPINATVTITGANSTVDFDGAAHTVTGYTATTTSTLYNVDSDFTFTPAENATLVNGVIAATRTEAGTTNMGLAATQFTNTNPNFATVTFEVTDGYLTVNAVDVVVTIKGRVDTVTYDGTAHTVTGYTATANSTLYNVEEDFSFTGTTEPTASQTTVGTAYMGLTDEQFENTNENFASVTFNVTDGHITVNPKAITIAAVDNSKVYGGTEPTLTATVTDVPESGADPVYSVSRAEGENVGEYAITVTASADANPNYNITTADGVFTITKATATVTASSLTKDYGQDDPALTATVSGLQNGDAESVINYTLARAAGDYVGTYTITPSGAAVQGNYDVVYQTGTLTIRPTVVFTTDPMPTSICSEGSISVAFDATIAGNNGNVTFAWSRNHTDDVTGTASGTGNINVALTAAATQTVTFTVTPTFNPTEGEAVEGTPATFDVTVNALPAVTTQHVNVNCAEMGSATITVTSTGTFTCAWNNGTAAALTQQDNDGHYYTHFGNLSEGDYPYVVTDANGCVTSGVISVEDPGRISVSQSISGNETCENTGVTVNYVIEGGTDPYTLTWMDADNDIPVEETEVNSLTGSHNFMLPVGEYRLALIIRDTYGCTGTASDTLTIVVRPIRTIVREININLSDPTYEYNGHTYNSNEVPPTETYTAANGCDSIISYVVNSYPLDILIADNCTLTRSSYTRAYSNTPRNLLGDTLYVRKNSLATFYAYLQDTELTQWNDEKMDMTYELLFNESGITDGDMPSLVSNFSISSYYDKTGQYYGIANLTAATGEIPNNTLAFRQTANSTILHFDYFYFAAFKNIPNKVTLTGLENGTYTLKLKAELRHSTGGTNRTGIYNPYIVGRKYGHLWGGYNDRPGNREVIAARTFTIIVNETGTNPNGAPMAVNEYAEGASVMAFPNPVNDQLNLRISGMSGATLITITDAHGKVVRTLNAELYGSEEVLTYNVADFAQGMYFINVRNNDTQVSEKFVVTHR